jgi:hypothetical protein
VEEEAILAVMDARQTPEGMTYRFVASEDDGWDAVPSPNSYWVAPERADDRTYQERYWSPYEFQIDGETAHCGIDVYSFAKINGIGKVSNSMWTVEPNACSELRPENPHTIRPHD